MGASQFQQQLAHAVEQGAVDFHGMPPRQGLQFRGQREYQMEVGNRQDARGRGIDPFLLRGGLTLGAVPVAAGIVDRMLPAAVRTDLQMAAQGSRATSADRRQNALLGSGENLQFLQGRSVRPERRQRCRIWALGSPRFYSVKSSRGLLSEAISLAETCV